MEDVVVGSILTGCEYNLSTKEKKKKSKEKEEQNRVSMDANFTYKLAD